jgi:hypothetical protein
MSQDFTAPRSSRLSQFFQARAKVSCTSSSAVKRSRHEPPGVAVEVGAVGAHRLVELGGTELEQHGCQNRVVRSTSQSGISAVRRASISLSAPKATSAPTSTSTPPRIGLPWRPALASAALREASAWRDP